MFELIEDRKKPEIRWWSIPATVFMVLLLGVNIGILIGRRKSDLDDWVQVAFLVFVTCIIVGPLMREIKSRIREKDVHDH